MALWLAVGWAQIWEVRALLEVRDAGDVKLHFVSRKGEEKTIFTTLRAGGARVELPSGFLPSRVILSAGGHLPVVLVYEPEHGYRLDFTDPKRLHSKSAYVLRDGRAALAAGDLGALPGEPHPVINAYDIELFLQAEKAQDLRADFTGDGRVDEKDFQLLLKNQSQLLETEL